MYNPYQALQYGGFQNPFSPMLPTQMQPQHAQPMQAANVLPPQQVQRANGKTSIDAIRMAPDSSVFVMDLTAPIVWLCVSDSLGNVTSTPYDIKPHEEPKAPDAGTLEARLAAVEGTVGTLSAKLEGLTNGNKPNAESPEQQQNNRAGG